MIYKVSYVVIGGAHPGAIANVEEAPRVGDAVTLGGETFEVVDVIELLPARGGFAFLHATCQPVEPEEEPDR